MLGNHWIPPTKDAPALGVAMRWFDNGISLTVTPKVIQSQNNTHTPIQQTNLECKFMDLTLFTPMTSLCANVRNQKQSLQASINFTAFFDTAALKNVPIWIQGTPLKK